MSTQQLLREYGLEPKKGLSQNFLVDPGTLLKIVEAADLAASDHILEVGPGLGVLTRALAERVASVVAVELDRHLVEVLRERLLTDLANVQLVAADILDVDVAQLMSSAERFKVVANLPYSITSAALRHLLEGTPAPELLVVMVQKEVAQRIIAEPGEMSLLALSVQCYGTPQIVSYVPAGCFYPRPSVDSAILRIDIHQDQLATPAELAQVFRLARAGFAQRRKQLHNSLAHGTALPPDQVDAALQASGIDRRRRPQSLSVQEWLRLAQFWPT